MSKSNIAVVMPTYNQKDITAITIEALQKQTSLVDIIVVDNDSIDGTSEEYTNKYPTITIIRTNGNYGGSGAFCIGADYAYRNGYEWIIFCDNDAVPISENLIEELVRNADPNTVTLPSRENGDEPGLPFHYGCYHKSIIEFAGLPYFDFFLCWDDVAYIMKVGTRVNVKILDHIFYVHPSKTPNTTIIYFAVRNGLLLHARKGAPGNKYLYALRSIMMAAIFRLLKEPDLAFCVQKAIDDFINNRIDNSFIKNKTKRFTEMKTSNFSDFSKKYFTKIDAPITKKEIISQVKSVNHNYAVIDGFDHDLVRAFMKPSASVILYIESLKDDIISYSEYKLPTYWLRCLIILFSLLLSTPKAIQVFQKVRQKNNYQNPSDYRIFISNVINPNLNYLPEHI